MENFTPGLALGGGVMIGAAAVALMLFSGRVAGIAGIVGGVFSSELPIRPLFRFTRQSDSEQRYLDWAIAGIADTLRAENVKWIHADPGPQSCRSNFCSPEAFIQIGSMASHGVLPSCLIETPALSSNFLWLLPVVLAVVGIWVLGRVVRRERRGV